MEKALLGIINQCVEGMKLLFLISREGSKTEIPHCIGPFEYCDNEYFVHAFNLCRIKKVRKNLWPQGL